MVPTETESTRSMRISYEDGQLSEQDIDPDAMVQFRRWFDDATQTERPEYIEPNAMTLSTIDASVTPATVRSRVVLLKEIGDRSITFYSNYNSAKAAQIESNASVAACFHWPHLQRQVRIVGAASQVPRSRSQEYFSRRPRASQIGAWVSRQSDVVTSRTELDGALAEIEARFAGGEVPCPDHWGGYDIRVDQIEFWQGRKGRLHDRIRYRRTEDGDVIERLAP